MHIIAINGYKSFIAKNFIKKYKKKYKISKKIKAKPTISLNKTSSKIVADMSLLKSFGYKSKKFNNANIFKK